MRVSFKPDKDIDLVEYMVMTATQDFLNTVKNNIVRGVARARYLGPPIDNPSGASDGKDEPNDGESATASNTGLSDRSIIFMSVASVGFIAAVGLVTYFRLKTSSRQDEIPYVATLENESSGEESPSHMESSGEDSQSHFRSIMPSNYRFDISESPFNSIATSSGPSSMGTIHESDDARSDGGLVVSDTGYSTEDSSSVEFPYFESNYKANAAPVLGARPRTVSYSNSV